MSEAPSLGVFSRFIPDELLVQQENFDTDLHDNVNIGPLNEEINFSITQEEILRCI